MKNTALKVVPREEVKIRPKYLHEIAAGTRLSEIFVYSQRDFYIGSRAEENSRNFDSNNLPFPFYDETNPIELGGSFTKEQIGKALHAMQKNEDPQITQLRQTIVETIEHKKLFNCVVRTAEDANKHGIVFIDEYLSDTGIPLGILAFDD